MLVIKTITAQTSTFFDNAVNEALADGWELVRRECFITGSDRATTFYAELERVIDEPEEEEYTPANFAEWVITRAPHYPYKCSACGWKIKYPIANCPNCKRLMKVEEI